MDNLLNFANPHYFSAILDGINHTFIIISESESKSGARFSPLPPTARFHVGAINAGRDPRNALTKQQLPLGVKNTPLKIPSDYLMLHQCIFLVNSNTDAQGWQYRSAWSNGIPSVNEEQWIKCPIPNSLVRRRVWFTTVVKRSDLSRSKRLLSENLKIDHGAKKMEGDLLRYEKGSLTKSWQRRKVVLYHNRIEIYSSTTKKVDVMLADCEVKMLSESQCPGKAFAFTIRNPLGSVGILFDGEDRENRRKWVISILYQLAIISQDLNFAPFEFGPPVGSYPHNRVLICSDLELLSKDKTQSSWNNLHFQLLTREIIWFQPNDYDNIQGRLFIEKASVVGDEKNLNFSIKSASNITLMLKADSAELKNLWLLGIRRQIQFIENQKLKSKTTPKEELEGELNGPGALEKVQQFFDDRWTAPNVEGADEEYYLRLLSSSTMNHPESVQFTSLKSLESSMDIKETETSGASGKISKLTIPSTTPKREDNKASALPSVPEDAPMSAPVSQYSSNAPSPASLSHPKTLSKTLSFREPLTSISSTSASADGQDNKLVAQLAMASSVSTDYTEDRINPMDIQNNGDSSFEKMDQGSKNISYSDVTTPSTISSKGTALPSSSTNSKITPTSALKPSKPSLISTSPTTTLTKFAPDPKRCYINPRFILTVLKGLTHRFVLVLESESRNLPMDAVNPVVYHPPRFTVGGPRACRDPRITPLNQLIEISNKKPEIQLPSGWIMLHQYIYVIQQNTDDGGWQYRSNWSDGLTGPGGRSTQQENEHWVEHCTDDKFVRRRLWMTTVVKRDDFIRAKKSISDNIVGVKNEIIMQGNLFRYQHDTPTQTSWHRIKVYLYHQRIEFFGGSEKKGELDLTDCEVSMLFGAQCPGRQYAFSIKNHNGSVVIWLDADSKEARRKWIHAIQYQLCICSPDINFPPLEFGPPTGDFAENRVLLCGDLQKCNNNVRQWKKLHFQLKLFELLFFERDVMKGRIYLEKAVVKSAMGAANEQEENAAKEFTIKAASGLILIVRADAVDLKVAWVKAVKRQIAMIDSFKQQRASTSPEEADLTGGGVITIRGRKQQYFDESWIAPDGDPDDDEYLNRQRVISRRMSRELWDDESFGKRYSSEAMLEYDSVDFNLQYGGSFRGDIKETDTFKFISFDEMPKFSALHQSLMAKYLTPDVFRQLQSRMTVLSSYTLSNLIQLGVVVPQTRIGVSIGDAECYDIFQELLFPILSELHYGFDLKMGIHPIPSSRSDGKLSWLLDPSMASKLQLSPLQQKILRFGYFANFSNDAHTQTNRSLVSFVRVIATRNLINYPMPPGVINEVQRKQIESLLCETFNQLNKSDYSGDYHSFAIESLAENPVRPFILECSQLFDIPVERPNHTSVGYSSYRSWPFHRGVFINKLKSTFMWVNDHEDHLRIIVTDPGWDIQSVFTSYLTLHAQLEKALQSQSGLSFSINDQLGYLSSNPANVGTCLRVAVTLNLPHFYNLLHGTQPSNGALDHNPMSVYQNLSSRADKAFLEDVCFAFDLEAIPHQTYVSGDDNLPPSTKFDIITTKTLGFSEVMLVQRLMDGVCTILELEFELGIGRTVDDIRDDIFLKRMTESRQKVDGMRFASREKSIEGVGLSKIVITEYTSTTTATTHHRSQTTQSQLPVTPLADKTPLRSQLFAMSADSQNDSFYVQSKPGETLDHQLDIIRGIKDDYDENRPINEILMEQSLVANKNKLSPQSDSRDDQNFFTSPFPSSPVDLATMGSFSSSNYGKMSTASVTAAVMSTKSNVQSTTNTSMNSNNMFGMRNVGLNGDDTQQEKGLTSMSSAPSVETMAFVSNPARLLKKK